MKKNPLKAIPKAISAMTLSLHWQRLPAAALLSVSFLCGPVAPVFAQDPGQNSAALNFVGADIESVVKAIGHFTGKTFIIDPRVKGQITLVSEVPLSKEQAFKLLTSNLRLQGFAVVTSDGYSKVVPEADAKLQAGPTQNDSVKGDQIATQIFHLSYESANNIVTVLRPLISPNNPINANPGNNSIVITDYADNLKRLSKIISALDVPASNDVEVFPIKYAIASDVAAMVNRLTEGSSAGIDAGRTVLLADPRTNSILIKAPSVARASLVKSIIAKLDLPTAMPGNVHVVYLKNAEAVKLAQTLRSILSSDSALPSSGSTTGFSPVNAANASGSNGNQGTNNSGNTGFQTSGQSGLPSNSGSNAQSGAGGGFIQADAATNTLIITASEAVYRNLRTVIDQLDARRAQVYVEALIVEVSAENQDDFGIQWLTASGDANSQYRVGGGTAFGTANNIMALAAANNKTKGSALPTNGFNVGIFKQVGNQIGLGALAHAMESDGKNNVLSIPNLLTLDNEEAKIMVGRNVPFITGQYTSAGTTGANPFQTIERRDVGIKLTVKPQISEGGMVKLAIFQEVSSVIDAAGNASGPTTSQRSIATTVLVDDGRIIALGGLMQDDNTNGVEKVPALGDIPFFGNLFKAQTKSHKKTNLMVFLRPTVIRSAEQSSSISIDRYDYMRSQLALPGAGSLENKLPTAVEGKLLTLPSDAIKLKEK